MNTWGIIKQLCSGKLIASTSIWIFVVPVIVKVYQGLNSGILLNGLEIIAPQSLIYLYFSAVAFFISNVLYIMLCPNLIKMVNHYSEFISLGCTAFDLSNSTNNVKKSTAKRLILRIKKEVESATGEDIDSTNIQTLTLTVGAAKEPQAFTFNEINLPIVFSIIYEFNLEKLWLVQSICWLFLSTGLGLLAYLLGINLFIVLAEIG